MNQQSQERVVAYLLGELNESETLQFEADRKTDPALERLVEEIGPVVEKLEELPPDAWETAPAPPPLVMPGTPPVADPVKTREKPGRRFLGIGFPRLAGALASAVLLFGAGIAVGTQFDGSDSIESGTPVQTVALQKFGEEAPPEATGEVLLTSSTGDSVNLDVSGLKPTGSGEFYELWLLGQDNELVALGTFRVEPDGSSNIQVPLPVDPDKYKYFDVSIQADNGDPNHSGRSVLRGVTRS
ncbi:MAG: anti-sigma factor [Solirubrobacterales bacterium]